MSDGNDIGWGATYPTTGVGSGQGGYGGLTGNGGSTDTSLQTLPTPDGGFVYGRYDDYGQWQTLYTYHPPAGSGGSSGSTWRPGEYELQEADTQLAYLKYQSDLLKDQQAALSDEWQNAVLEGDLKRQMAADAEIKRNNAEIARLNEQSNAISVYSSQLSSRASLANTAANVATTASEWAANPRNEFALLKLQETGLTGGSATPLNAASYNPETMGAYGTALDQRFNDIFGGVGKQLADALAATNQVPVSAQPWYQSDPNYGSLNPNQQAIARNYSPDERGQYQNFMNMTPQQKQYVIGGAPAGPTPAESQAVYAGLSDEGKRYVQEMAKRGTPSMAGGGKMTVNAPVAIVDLLTKRLIATAAEQAPEQITITPMKEPKQDGGGNTGGVQSFASGGTISAGQAFGSNYGKNYRHTPYKVGDRGPGYNIAAPRSTDPGMIQSADRGQANYDTWATAHPEFFSTSPAAGVVGAALARGYRVRPAAGSHLPTSAGTPVGGTGTPGTSTTTTGADSPAMILAKQLAATMKPLGFDYTPTAGNYAPPTNMLVGTPWARLQNYPPILQALLAAASASGMSPEAYLAERKLFQPTAPSYSGVSYGF